MAKLLKVRAESRKYYKRGKFIPLPSLASTVDNTPLANYFLAYLDCSHIYITHMSDAERLYQMGFFGKGALSRGPLDYHSYQYSNTDKGQMKVLSKRRYLKHKLWKKTGRSLNSATSDHYIKSQTSRRGFKSTDSSIPLRNTRHTLETNVSGARESTAILHCQSQEVTAEDIVNFVIPETKKIIDPWEGAGGDENFWGDPDEIVYTVPPLLGTTNDRPQTELDKNIKAETSKNSSHLVVVTNADMRFWKEGTDPSEDNNSDHPQRQTGSERTTDGNTAELSSLTELPENKREHKPENGQSEDSDSENGDVLVMDDSMTENESDSESHKSGTARRWQLCLRKDPSPIRERLELSPEETLFLTYGLGCLVVKDNKTEENLNISQLWKIFRSFDPIFIPRYIAYHYYRSKGWVLKNGLKYGADFVLYKKGPAYFHSSFSILIKPVVEPNHDCDPLFPTKKTNWRSLTCVDRVIDTVAKEMLYCYVVRPCDLTEEELSSPKCIPRFRVCEMHLKRWVSKEQRDQIGST